MEAETGDQVINDKIDIHNINPAKTFKFTDLFFQDGHEQANYIFYQWTLITAKTSFTHQINNSYAQLENLSKSEKSNALKTAMEAAVDLFIKDN